MYKVTTKKGSLYFLYIEEVWLYLEKLGTTLFEDGSYVKISFKENVKE